MEEMIGLNNIIDDLLKYILKFVPSTYWIFIVQVNKKWNSLVPKQIYFRPPLKKIAFRLLVERELSLITRIKHVYTQLPSGLFKILLKVGEDSSYLKWLISEKIFPENMIPHSIDDEWDNLISQAEKTDMIDITNYVFMKKDKEKFHFLVEQNLLNSRIAFNKSPCCNFFMWDELHRLFVMTSYDCVNITVKNIIKSGNLEKLDELYSRYDNLPIYYSELHWAISNSHEEIIKWFIDCIPTATVVGTLCNKSVISACIYKDRIDLIQLLKKKCSNFSTICTSYSYQMYKKCLSGCFTSTKIKMLKILYDKYRQDPPSNILCLCVSASNYLAFKWFIKRKLGTKHGLDHLFCTSFGTSKLKKKFIEYFMKNKLKFGMDDILTCMKKKKWKILNYMYGTNPDVFDTAILSSTVRAWADNFKMLNWLHDKNLLIWAGSDYIEFAVRGNWQGIQWAESKNLPFCWYEGFTDSQKKEILNRMDRWDIECIQWLKSK